MGHKDVCDRYCYNEEKVERVREQLGLEDISSVAGLFKSLADENRAKITFALAQGTELCVCDLSHIIHSTVATASYHLRILHKQNIVKYRKEGKLALYSLDDAHIGQLIQITLAHMKEVKASV